MAVSSAAAGGGVPIFPGECVEIHGLTSAAGSELNGQNGVVTKMLRETGRFEVRVGVDRRVTLKPENLKLVQKNQGAAAEKLGFGAEDRKAECAAAAAFREGDLIEVFELEGMQAKELNGKTGTVVLDYETPPDRVKVKVNLGTLMGQEKFRHATLKPANLKKVTFAGLTDEQRAQMPSLKDDREGGGESMQENILRSQLSRLSAQERHSGVDPFSRVDLSVEPGGASAGGFSPGNLVEVSGLTSAAGQQLNGERGVVLTCFEADGRAEVRLPEGVKKLKLGNLKKLDLGAGDRFMAEVFGLQSEAGRAMNGQRGIATSRNLESGRFEVKFSKDKVMSLKPDNLRLLTKKK
mmetsp:Transcript_8427/g.10981  ORF Transcript_8427/g.10981 Transcript_8427/m.10981 type:complete len:351 (+) Transcript_8427:44-1096(+)